MDIIDLYGTSSNRFNRFAGVSILFLPVNVDNIYTKIRSFMPGSLVRILLDLA